MNDETNAAMGDVAPTDPIWEVGELAEYPTEVQQAIWTLMNYSRTREGLIAASIRGSLPSKLPHAGRPHELHGVIIGGCGPAQMTTHVLREFLNLVEDSNSIGQGEVLAWYNAPATKLSPASRYELMTNGNVMVDVSCGQNQQAKRFRVAKVLEVLSPQPYLLLSKPFGFSGVQDVIELCRRFAASQAALKVQADAKAQEGSNGAS